MGERIVVETDCPHGYGPDIYNPTCVNHGICPGGSRRVLTEGEYVLIERADGEWHELTVQRLIREFKTLYNNDDSLTIGEVMSMERTLDALAGRAWS